jgi:predicted transcriptional regulator
MKRPDLLDSPTEIGKRIGAACGYAVGKTYGEIAEELGRSDTTLRSYIRGNLGDYSTRELRRDLVRRIEAITGCPPEFFALSEPARDEALEETRRAVAALARLLTESDLDSATRQLLEGELAAARQWSTSTPPIEEPGTGAGNG